MWSLSIEEQFYLIWPVVLVVFFALFRGRRRIVAATVVLATASFALMWWLAATGADHTRIYEGTDTRAGGLLLGRWPSHSLSDATTAPQQPPAGFPL